MRELPDGLKVSDAAYDWLMGKKQAGVRVVMVVPDDQAPGSCMNCGGMGNTYFNEILGGPFSTPPAGLSYSDGTAWYRVEGRGFACPACNSGSLAMLARLWDDSGLLLEERDWRLDYIAEMTGKVVAATEARKVAADMPHAHGWVLFYGKYGAGKTGILKCIVAAALRAGVAARYVHAIDIIDDLRSTFHSDAPNSVAGIKAKLAAIPVLAVDEIHRHGDTPFAVDEFASIMDDRYAARKRRVTVMALDIAPEELDAGKLGYLASRLMDRDGVRRVPVGGMSLRLMTPATSPEEKDDETPKP